MVASLEELGLREAFDVVYGSSSGSFAAAAFLARKARDVARAYYEDLIDRRFIDSRRILRRQPLLSLTYLIDEVIEGVHGIDWHAVLQSEVPFHALAYSLDRGETVDLTGCITVSDLKQSLHATARIPLVAGGPVEIDGDRLLDGSLLEPIPFRSAIGGGATHVLALATRPEGVNRAEPSLVERTLLARLLRRLDPRLVELQRTRAQRYNADLETLKRFGADPAGPPHVVTIRPGPSAVTVSQMEQRPEALKLGAQAGEAAVANAFAFLTDPEYHAATRTGSETGA
jgi:predicted patatin/cPLA2 family phospholipase